MGIMSDEFQDRREVVDLIWTGWVREQGEGKDAVSEKEFS
jgi:hypothetical protein